MRYVTDEHGVTRTYGINWTVVLGFLVLCAFAALSRCEL